MPADQTVISLRPGGGGAYRAPRFQSTSSSSSSSSDNKPLRPHGGASSSLSFQFGDVRYEGGERVRYSRDQLLQLREVVVIPEEILGVKRDIDSELHGEEQSWNRAESNPLSQPQGRYSEPDNRDWRSRSIPQVSSIPEERSWESIRDREFVNRSQDTNRSDQLNSQFARAHISSSQGHSFGSQDKLSQPATLATLTSFNIV